MTRIARSRTRTLGHSESVTECCLFSDEGQIKKAFWAIIPVLFWRTRRPRKQPATGKRLVNGSTWPCVLGRNAVLAANHGNGRN
jgi:hypothetical protein